MEGGGGWVASLRHRGPRRGRRGRRPCPRVGSRSRHERLGGVHVVVVVCPTRGREAVVQQVPPQPRAYGRGHRRRHAAGGARVMWRSTMAAKSHDAAQRNNFSLIHWRVPSATWQPSGASVLSGIAQPRSSSANHRAPAETMFCVARAARLPPRCVLARLGLRNFVRGGANAKICRVGTLGIAPRVSSPRRAARAALAARADTVSFSDDMRGIGSAATGTEPAATTGVTTVSIPHLVALLLDLSEEGQSIIRAVTRGGDLDVKDKGGRDDVTGRPYITRSVVTQPDDLLLLYSSSCTHSPSHAPP